MNKNPNVLLNTSLSISNGETGTDEHQDRVAGENMQIVLSLNIAAGLCAGAPCATTHQPPVRQACHTGNHKWSYEPHHHHRPVVICSIGQIW